MRFNFIRCADRSVSVYTTITCSAQDVGRSPGLDGSISKMDWSVSQKLSCRYLGIKLVQINRRMGYFNNSSGK